MFVVTTLPPVDPKKITVISLVTLGPWNLFLSWEAPNGVNPNDITRYDITGSFVQDYTSKTKYNFIPLSYGILPSSSYVVTVTVVYRTGERSDPISVSVSTPSAGKFCSCVLGLASNTILLLV